MTSRIAKPDYQEAAELAKAMRAGIDDWRSTPVAPGSYTPSSGLADLAGYANLRALPPLARKGRLTSGIVRAARSVLRALLRPWLAVQTEFNQGVMTELDDLRRRISALEGIATGSSPPAAMPVRQRAVHRPEVEQDEAVP